MLLATAANFDTCQRFPCARVFKKTCRRPAGRRRRKTQSPPRAPPPPPQTSLQHAQVAAQRHVASSTAAIERARCATTHSPSQERPRAHSRSRASGDRTTLCGRPRLSARDRGGHAGESWRVYGDWLVPRACGLSGARAVKRERAHPPTPHADPRQARWQDAHAARLCRRHNSQREGKDATRRVS